MESFRLDKSAFSMHHTKDAKNNYDYWKGQTFEERLRAAYYLNSVSYNFPIDQPAKIDRNYFKMRHRK